LGLTAQWTDEETQDRRGMVTEGIVAEAHSESRNGEGHHRGQSGHGKRTEAVELEAQEEVRESRVVGRGELDTGTVDRVRQAYRRRDQGRQGVSPAG